MLKAMWSSRFLLACLLSSFATLLNLPAQAQLSPDATLGAESSVVTPDVIVKGELADLIEGGAVRGSNLFHSFSDFSILDAEQVYFANPEGIELILSRVTGSEPSNIFGTLGVDGAADLFFINPSGLFFGENASLDVNGSFVGTTADSLRFGDHGVFSATDPEAPSELLTINPSALLFAPSETLPNEIVVEGDGSGTRFSIEPIDTQVGLRVPTEQTLALIGGDLEFVGGTLKTAGGRIELGSVASGSTISMVPDDSGWTFDYNDVQDFRNIQLSQQSTVDASGLGSGDIRLQGRQIDISGGSQIEASTLGTLSGGSLKITANEVRLYSTVDDDVSTGLYALVYSGASGDGGDVTISTQGISVRSADIFADTYGQGDAGDLSIRSRDSVEVVDISSITGFSSSVTAGVGSSATGKGGNLTIETTELRVIDGGQVSASTFGAGDAGREAGGVCE